MAVLKSLRLSFVAVVLLAAVLHSGRNIVEYVNISGGISNCFLSTITTLKCGTNIFFFRGPIRSGDQPPVPRIVPIFSIQRDPVRPP